MKRLALVLDIGFGTLEGSERSAARMRELLTRRGYEVTALRGPEVVRERVKAELAAQQRRLGPDDSFVFYFVGHGEKLRGQPGEPLAAGAPPASGDTMLLISHDIFDRDEPHPGIAGTELIAWIDPIAERTGEVTIFLDCCRAAGMTADGPAIDAAAQARVDAALVRAAPQLRAKYGVRALGDGDTDGPIVRVVATTRNATAVERVLEDGAGRIGVFTEAVVALLERHADDDLSWDELMPELQEAVNRECETQWPGVEGARHRVPFNRRERPPVDEYPCRATRGGWKLQAGALHGVEVGERFALATATAVATTVGLDGATLELEADADLPAIVRARRLSCPRPQKFTWPIGQAPPEALAEAPELALVEASDDVVAAVEFTAHGVILREGGVVVHAEADRAPRAQRGLVQAMRRVARWRRQSLALAGLGSPPLISHTWGLVGSDEPLPATPELHAGDRVWVRVWGTGAAAEVFVSLFRLRADRSLVHCNPDLDHGASVGANRSVDLTALAGGATRPVALEWREHVPPDGPRDEALVLLATTRPRVLHRVATSVAVDPTQTPPWTPRADPEDPGVVALLLPYRLFPAARGSG